MKIEKLDTDKIRITLNFDDLKNNNIDFNSFMSNSTESKNLFLYILDLAEEELGFITDNYKISVETLYLNNGCFILNITRFKSDNIFKNPRVITRKKEISTQLNSSIYIFSSIDNFLDFYLKIKQSINLNLFIDCKYSLYFLNNNYYMTINSDCLNIKYQTEILYILSEFSNLASNTPSFIFNLKEYGKCICNNKNFV